MSTPIVLTDSPEIVELKREFRRLDEVEQTLKVLDPKLTTSLEKVRESKRQIALQIFHLGGGR